MWLDNTKDGIWLCVDDLLDSTQVKTQWRRVVAETFFFHPNDRLSQAMTECVCVMTFSSDCQRVLQNIQVLNRLKASGDT